MVTHRQSIVPVILSGGTGSRLWPLSRQSHPKPFLLLPDGETLLQKTYHRASKLATDMLLTVTSKSYHLKCKELFNNSFEQSMHYLLEPFPRNTAPAILFAALRINEMIDKNAILLVLPADHLITNEEVFINDCQKGFELANQNKLVTFGIKPSRAETSFGYIECFSDLSVKRFVEKPSLIEAKYLIEHCNSFWNAGIFCFKAEVLLTAFEAYQPDMYAKAKLWSQQITTTSQIPDDVFENLPNISLDYAILEKASSVAMVKSAFDWDDIGSFSAYQKLFKADDQDNMILGDVISLNSHHNFIYSEKRMVATIGIENLIVVDTPDALLVADNSQDQAVKNIVEKLNANNHPSCVNHQTVIRPWGSYTVLEENNYYKIKKIWVKPKASLSLQKHLYRSEHWVVIQGKAFVVNGDKEYDLLLNESTYVPAKTIHRLSNPTDDDLIIVEVQTGSYVGEDDIIRLEDVYGRLLNENENSNCL